MLNHCWPIRDMYFMEGVGMGQVIAHLCTYVVVFFAAISLPEEGKQLLYEDTQVAVY